MRLRAEFKHNQSITSSTLNCNQDFANLQLPSVDKILFVHAPFQGKMGGGGGGGLTCTVFGILLELQGLIYQINLNILNKNHTVSAHPQLSCRGVGGSTLVEFCWVCTASISKSVPYYDFLTRKVVKKCIPILATLFKMPEKAIPPALRGETLK